MACRFQDNPRSASSDGVPPEPLVLGLCEALRVRPIWLVCTTGLTRSRCSLLVKWLLRSACSSACVLTNSALIGWLKDFVTFISQVDYYIDDKNIEHQVSLMPTSCAGNQHLQSLTSSLARRSVSRSVWVSWWKTTPFLHFYNCQQHSRISVPKCSRGTS